jgi:UDP-N-acetylglucosamine 2-epimerase (non-hydrolysing)
VAPTVLYVLGARPNFVKMAPVIAELRRRVPDGRHVVVHTGQHYDDSMSRIFLDELAVGEPDHMLGVGAASHAVQTARVMERIEPVLVEHAPDMVVLPGDVNSTLAAALVAVKLGLPIAHVESGLRSFDRSMPEEINRIVADEFAELLFVHCDDAVRNLRDEGISHARVHFVGNTMIDTLARLEPRFRALDASRRFGVRAGDYLLTTLHRPALVDGPLVETAMTRLEALAGEVPVIFPVHPRTRKMIAGRRPTAGLHLSDPVGYLEFLSLEADAAAVLTDSGGVQEETTHLGVACFTLRANTERPVTIRLGTNTLLGLDPARIADIPDLLAGGRDAPRQRPPLWDGHAATRIADVVVDRLGPARRPPVVADLVGVPAHSTRPG